MREACSSGESKMVPGTKSLSCDVSGSDGVAGEQQIAQLPVAGIGQHELGVVIMVG
jgi:hypothetical protein